MRAFLKLFSVDFDSVLIALVPHFLNLFIFWSCAGNYWDAVLSLSLGLGVGIIYLLAPHVPVLRNVVEFVAALVVSFLARLFAFYLSQLDVCFFAMAISGLVWLLPG